MRYIFIQYENGIEAMQQVHKWIINILRVKRIYVATTDRGSKEKS